MISRDRHASGGARDDSVIYLMSLSEGKIFFLATIALMFLFLSPIKVLAEGSSEGSSMEAQNKASYFGIKPIAEKGGLTSNAVSKSGSVPALIGNIVGVALSFVGAAFFILILYAGILWMTAAGNAERVESAKKILIAAAIGLIIVLSAYAITRFVFSGLGVAGGGSSAPTNGQVVNCSADNVGEPCGKAMACGYGGSCVTKCEYQYGAQSGECQSRESCEFGIDETACPAENEVCCYAN